MSSASLNGDVHGDKLYLSSVDCKIAGLCGGIGEYTGINSNIIRSLYIIFSLITGILPGLLVYYIAVVILQKSDQ